MGTCPTSSNYLVLLDLWGLKAWGISRPKGEVQATSSPAEIAVTPLMGACDKSGNDEVFNNGHVLHVDRVTVSLPNGRYCIERSKVSAVKD